MNILIVDDNPDYRFLMDMALSMAGYTTYVAEDGLDGIDVLEAHDINLIISDIRMPRMDGIRLNAYARATAKYRTTKFVFVSGFKEVYLGRVALDPRLDYLLDKTTPSEELVHLVNKLLEQDSPGPSPGIQ